MKNTTTILLSFILLFAIGGCSGGGGFKKTKSGIVYKVVDDKKDPIAKVGEFLKGLYTKTVRDVIIAAIEGALATYAKIDSRSPVDNPLEVFNKLRKGDS